MCHGYPEDGIRKIILCSQASDMNPDNLLWKDGDMSVLKIADFGLAREIRGGQPYTEYISTRWYRAPENILRIVNYNFPVDILACCIIMTELHSAPIIQNNGYYWSTQFKNMARRSCLCK